VLQTRVVLLLGKGFWAQGKQAVNNVNRDSDFHKIKVFETYHPAYGGDSDRYHEVVLPDIRAKWAKLQAHLNSIKRQPHRYQLFCPQTTLRAAPCPSPALLSRNWSVLFAAYCEQSQLTVSRAFGAKQGLHFEGTAFSLIRFGSESTSVCAREGLLVNRSVELAATQILDSAAATPSFRQE